MAIDRIHWKVGDWILVIGQGIRPIETLDEQNVVCKLDGKIRVLTYDQVAFKAVAESANLKIGDVVYIDGKHLAHIGYVQRAARMGYVDYIETYGKELVEGDRLTITPLDPDLVHKSELREWRLEYEAFQTRLSEVMATAPSGIRRWASDVQEMFDNEFEEQLRGERDD